MSAQIIPFTYTDHTEVRVATIDGDPWFVLADLCRALGLSNPRMVASRLSDDVSQAYPIPDALGRIQQTTIVSEPGMYEVVIRSDAPAAEPFRRWLTHDVIPSIRKTGSYGVAKALPKDYAAALRELAAQVEAHELAKVRIRELEPAASAWHSMASAEGDFSVEDAAKALSRDPSISIGRNRLFDWMQAHGWIYRRQDGRARAYQSKVDAGLLVEKLGTPYLSHKLGEYVAPAPTIRIKPKGMDRLYRELGGMEPMVEAS